MRCCGEGACEGVDWGWDVYLVGKDEQKVASVGYTSWIWFQVYDFMIFTTFYDRLLTGARN